ncbi:M1 family metallopeptidase [Sediminicola arcticus]|jgi:aminopeptidase N|uniref:Aminopeptidase N n=1 Tax=Sediminicola arcticus TaxID=1574308 RepID=A0ABV2SU76_9FLAO
MLKVLVSFFLCLFQISFAQRQDRVDFTHANVSINIDPYSQEIMGSVIYTFETLEKVSSFFLDAKAMEFSKVLLNNKKVNYENDGNKIILFKKLNNNTVHTLMLTYTVKPSQAVYFIGWDRKEYNPQIWTQGQGKYTSNWLPSFDDMTEKIEFDLELTFDKKYEVIANGILKNTEVSGELKTWYYDMVSPMSSYLVAFAIGNYHQKEESSNSGIPLKIYYYPSDSLNVEPTYRYSRQIFDFLETEIGVPYPWQNYKQIPVRDFLYAGMENTGTTIFSDAYVIDSTAFIDKNYVNINAHELAHQWFGNLVTEQDASHHWLQEGFATYYTYLSEKEMFGYDTFYWKLYETAQQLKELSSEGQGEALTNPKASSLTFYEKGAWALFMLNEHMGEKAYKKGISEYIQKYQFQEVTLPKFIEIMEVTSDLDLSEFETLWLKNSEFPFDRAMESLKKHSSSIAAFFELQRELMTTKGTNETIIQRFWNETQSDFFKMAIVKKYNTSLSEPYMLKIFKESSVKVRQALAISSSKIPKGLKLEFESLLDDASYVTKENALYKLWVYFPEDRETYLNKTKDCFGLPNKNVRLLWLTLALITKDYQPENNAVLYAELSGYTAPSYPMEVRQGAFQYLSDTVGLSDQNLLDLIKACLHHSWQFKKFSRDLLDQLLKREEYKKRINGLKGKLNIEELRYINSKIT